MILRIIEVIAMIVGVIYALLAILSMIYRLWNSRHMKWIPLFVLLTIPSITQADPYYNSSETGCDGSDSTKLFCDDFEDGVWYATDCDTSGGITNAANDGWCGTIFANPITPANAIISGVTPFGTYAANGGDHGGGAGGVNMAQHRLKTASCGTDGSQFCDVSEIYVRWYAKWEAGYSFGAEKHLNVTNSDGDIAFANVQLNCGFGSADTTAIPYIQIIHGESLCQAPNQTDITLQSNHWYFFEFHVIAHATNGTVELWINDCGTAGTSCGASPVLRTRLTGQRLPGNSNGSSIQTIWLENWANPGSTGEGPYWDNIIASTTGPIGFSGSSSTPSIVIFLEWITGLLSISWHFRNQLLAASLAVVSIGGTVWGATKGLTYNSTQKMAQVYLDYSKKSRN